MAAVVAAAAQVDAEIVLVRPPAKLRRDRLPPNVRVVDRVPLDRVLPQPPRSCTTAARAVSSGALAAGVPQLACPGPGDRRHNASLVARRGAGLSVAAKAITAATLTRLISDGALVAAAREVRDEIAAMPPPADLVPDLEALVRAAVAPGCGGGLHVAAELLRQREGQPFLGGGVLGDLAEAALRQVRPAPP